MVDLSTPWTQLSLLPPSDTVLELVVTCHHLEELTTISVTVASGPPFEVVAMQVWPAVPEQDTYDVLSEVLGRFTGLLRDATGPF